MNAKEIMNDVISNDNMLQKHRSMSEKIVCIALKHALSGTTDRKELYRETKKEYTQRYGIAPLLAIVIVSLIQVAVKIIVEWIIAVYFDDSDKSELLSQLYDMIENS